MINILICYYKNGDDMRKILFIFISILIIIITCIILSNKKYGYHIKNNVPIIDIELKDISLDKINKGSKEIKYKDNSIKIYNKNHKLLLKDNITIKGRGNFTWKLEKKPYQISFEDKQELFNLANTKKYVLLANTLDPSLLKNHFTYKLAKEMRMNYGVTGTFIDLYVNKKYIGNYYLVPKISIDKNIVDLKDDDAILVELDNNYYKEEDYVTSKLENDHFIVKDSNNDDYKDDLDVFMDKYNEVEKLIKEKNFKDLEKIIDMDSFVKYYIITEFSLNIDGLQSSLYLYMDGHDDKIHVGPVWDYDIAYNNSFLRDITKFPIKNRIRYEKHTSLLLYNLCKIDEFNKLVKKTWNDDVKRVYKKNISSLNKEYKKLYLSGKYNNEHWKFVSFEKSYNMYKKWLNDRYQIFDNEINK